MSDESHPEIVIIRRGGHGDHDEHHGGVWKIAFADFMTAMMAFFLVMWLISANDKTRASVARYFNPVRLVDATTQPRGLHNTKKDESGITASPDNKKADDKQEKAGETPDPESKQGKGETAAQREARLDTALSRNPFSALAEIAKGDDGTKKSAFQPAATIAVGRRGGAAYRDPFAPPPPPPAARTADAAPEAAAATASPPSGGSAAHADAGETDALHAAAKQVRAALAAFKPQGGREGPQVDITRTDEGLLVSFTDTDAFSMFSNGSAVPARRLVLMMERVGRVLADVRGTVIVRGYTDNKPYRSGRYDNWRLSLDRAQVTHYMLVRGGLADARIGHVEGYADRGGRTGMDPASPLNRRIEILVKERS